MRTKRKSDEPPARQGPDLPHPDNLARVTFENPLAGLPLTDLTIEDALVEGQDVSGHRISSLIAKGCVLRDVSFANCEIGSIRLRDVRLVKCDLSNSLLRVLEANRVEFVDCRLIGMRAAESRCNNMLIENCDGRYTQWNDGQMRLCEFRGSQFAECDLRSTDLEAPYSHKRRSPRLRCVKPISPAHGFRERICAAPISMACWRELRTCVGPSWPLRRPWN